jgi:hypothetical protein
MPYQILFNAVSTYKDKLLLNVGYDAGKLSEEIAMELAVGMREALQEATVAG